MLRFYTLHPDPVVLHPRLELPQEVDVSSRQYLACARSPPAKAALASYASQWLTIRLRLVAPAVRCKMSTLPLLGNPANRGRDWFAAFGGTAPAPVAVFDRTETGSRLLPLSHERL